MESILTPKWVLGPYLTPVDTSALTLEPYLKKTSVTKISAVQVVRGPKRPQDTVLRLKNNNMFCAFGVKIDPRNPY